MRKILFFIGIVFSISFISGSSSFAAMSSYCAAPPFVTQSVIPNVLIILDNSGSMYDFAYKTTGTGNDPKNPDQSFSPSTVYYGYFNSQKKYSYSTNSGGYFYENSNGSWDGNFLNWLTMRRVDVVRKVLVGGKEINRANPTSAQYLIGAETPDRDYAKRYSNITPYTLYTGQQDFFVYNGNFYVGYWQGNKFWYYDRPYHIKVKVSEEQTGVVQQTWDKVRFGLMFFNYGDKFEGGGRNDKDGGYVSDWITGPGSNISLVTKIENTNPSTWTPLAESLYEATRYFGIKASAYQKSNYSAHDPIQYRCQKNFDIILTDGESTKDENLPGGYWGSSLTNVSDGFNVKTWMDKIAANEGYSSQWKKHANDMQGTYYLEGVAYWAHMSDLRSDFTGKQNLTTYTVLAFNNSPIAQDILKKTAKYGGFIDQNGNGIPDLESEWDQNGNGIPDNYFKASDGYQLKISLESAISNILKRASSGSAASVVSTSGKAGANIVQALFFPKKVFSSGTEISWAGDLKNFWYYLGPFAQNIREDNYTSTADTSGPTLDLAKDYIMEFNSSDPSKVNLFADADGNGAKDSSTPIATISINDTIPVWDAGNQLFKQSAASRDIFTATGGGSTSAPFTSTPFTSNFALKLEPYLDTSSSTSAADLINYIRGDDSSGFRSRTVTMDGQTGVYKLGDIIYSTPKIVSSIPVGSYYKDYGDQTYKDFIDSAAYKDRMGIVVVGANDGMLHAFKLGRPTVLYGQGSKIFTLNRYESGGTSGKPTLGKPLGSELWAYIPENILPYLKYYADPNYCHLYYVDLTPTIVDASVYNSSNTSYNNVADDIKTKDSWRTILIGGLRLGGACGASNSSSPAIHPPALSSPAAGVGRSSYFALDITNTEHPKLLWEFTDNNLAFSTTGPAIIHIPAKKTVDGNPVDDNTKNGNWYVVFASGPDKYNGTIHQPLFLYALDLGTGKLERKWQLSGSNCTGSSSLTCDTTVTGNYDAFAGRLTNGVIDLGVNYSDDALYFGYNYKQGSNWDGGVLRLVTDDKTPTNWQISKLIGGIGPVTASTSVLQDKTNNKLWVFAGTGRYFTATDDSDAQRDLYGVIDPCYNGSGYNNSCSPISGSGSLTDVTSDPAAANITNGWYINLDPATSSANSERMISDPTVSSNGTVFFATTAPTSDICSYGGNSRVYELNYSNGGAVSELSPVLIQTSTGAITRVNKSYFSGPGSEGGRRSGLIPGVTSPGPTVVSIGSPHPINRFIHWYER